MDLKSLRDFYHKSPLLTAGIAGVFFSVFLTYAVTFATGDTFGLWRMIGVSTPSWNRGADYADCSKFWNRSSRYCTRGVGTEPAPVKNLPNNDFDRIRRNGKKAVPFTLH